MRAASSFALLVMWASHAVADPEPPPDEVSPGSDAAWWSDPTAWASAVSPYRVAVHEEVEPEDLSLVESRRYHPAHWEPVPRPSDDDPDRRLHLELDVGILAGVFRVGHVAGSAIALDVAAGLRRDRLALLGQYALFVLDEDTPIRDPRRALIHRVGAVLRVSPFRVGMRSPRMRADFWLDAGAGYEIVRWDDGGRLRRADVALGIGGQGTIRFGPGHRRKVGAYYALRLLFAPHGPDKAPASGCAGPCDEPTRPTPFDLGLMLQFGFLFGR